MYDVFKYPLISTYLFIIDLFLVLINLAFTISFESNNASRSLELSLEPSMNTTTHPSMTTLLTHTVVYFTKPSFMPKTNNQPPKKFLSLALS